MNLRRCLLLIFAGISALALHAETPEPAPEDPRDAAKREAWTSVVLIISLLEQGDNAAFPGIRAWLDDFRAAAGSMPVPEPGRAFPPIDADAVVTRNPNFWRAFYEIQPADPGLALLHSALLLSGGEAQRAAAIAAFGLQGRGVPLEMKRGLTSIIAQCESAQARSMAFLRQGTKLHDRRDYAGALGFYERAIEEWPANGAAQAERGLTFRIRAVSEARERAKDDGPDAIFAPADPPETAAAFAIARRHDPLNLLAYQGDDAAILTSLMALVQSGLPVWETIRKKPEQAVRQSQLRAFSEACRDAAIDDYALVLRQLVVAADKRYRPEDEEFIGQCLERLAPAALTEALLARIGGETRIPTRHIVVPLTVDPPEVAQSATEDGEKKAEPANTPEPKAKTAATTKGKSVSSSSKKKTGKTTAKSGSSSKKPKATAKSGTSKSKRKSK